MEPRADGERLRGGTNDQISVQRPSCWQSHGCDICDYHEVDDPGTCVVELVDSGRNWLDVLDKDVLHLCGVCARQHQGDLLERIEAVLDA